ncbi:phage tail tube protein [Vreelandella alkaliphila]|uniref:Phage tail protein n=1 Tax=Vreelandella alkaliphila TaxID=272774 RepID=A0A7C9NQR0_9GAMM|nr:phage tail tube protein [Halomonas alkaliphila]NDL70507.1 phage tail protein [Halomonas alkaliphila]
MARKAKFQLTKGTVVEVSAAAVATLDATVSEWLKISTTSKEISYTGGQKQEIDVTVLESEEQEMENGLRAPGELTISGNWTTDDPGQDSLRDADADADDTYRQLRVTFENGKSARMLVQVRQENWSIAPNGVASGGFNLRIMEGPAYGADAGGGE